MKIIKKIGSGGISNVFLVASATRKYAFKTLNLLKKSDNKAMLCLENEYDILKKLDHPNIVKCFGWANIDEREGILLEFIDGFSLSESIDEKLTFDFDKLEKVLEYLHNRCIVHNDITQKNIMIDNKENLKLIDFSMSYEVSSEYYNDFHIHCQSDTISLNKIKQQFI